jgi:periodic tryptophan protein 1
MLQQGDRAVAIEDDSDDEDADDDEIKLTDSLIAVAITDDEDSHLEIQLMTEDGDLYTHHDIALPDFPLCLAWMDCPPYQSEGQQQVTGNYMGITTVITVNIYASLMFINFYYSCGNF